MVINQTQRIASNYGQDIYFSQQLVTLVTKQDQRLCKTSVYYLKFSIKVFGGDEF